MKTKNTQANNPVEWLHQVILSMIITKYIANKVFDYIYTWGENLAYIPQAIKDYYQCTIQDTPSKSIFGRDMIFNLASVVQWGGITAYKKR